MNSCMQATEGIGCNTCATDFARTDSNIFICTECVAWLPIRFSWHKPTRPTEIYTDLCACLPQYMKSRRLVERTVPKTRRFELVSRCFTWDPNPRSSHQHPNVASCYSGGVGELQAKAKDIRRKIKGGATFLSVATLSSLPFQQFLVSRGGFTCLSCWASGPQTSCCTEAGVITAQRRSKTSNLQAWQNSSPETCSPRESVENLDVYKPPRVKALQQGTQGLPNILASKFFDEKSHQPWISDTNSSLGLKKPSGFILRDPK